LKSKNKIDKKGNMTHSAEFIGTKIKVLRSDNKSLERLEGKIIDETRNTFRIMNDQNQEKTLLKNGVVFLIDGKKIQGNEIMRRPEERIKLKK
jgi:ribonuclease P protein subunit POP4